MMLTEYLENLKGKSIAVIGLGVSNKPLIKMLLKAGLSVTGRDIKSLKKFGSELDDLIAMGLRLKLGADYLESLNEDIIFRTPGLSPNTPELLRAQTQGSIITSEMEVFFRVCHCPIVGVTGSDGKTTTTSIIAHMLNSEGFTIHLGGNIGNPLLSSVPDISRKDFAVLELSSFQLMTMKMSPNIAVVTNISPNHLDYHSDMNEYIQAKKNIFAHQKPDDLLILNMDNEITNGFTAPTGVRTMHFSTKTRPKNGFFLRGDRIMLIEDREETEVIETQNILLRGIHNVENLMAAFAAVYDITGLDCCREAAENFPGVEHRMEKVREAYGVAFYNDSIASSPTRTIAGLLSFDQKVILIAGGYDKNIPYDDLGYVIRDKVKTLVLTGATAQKIKAATQKACCNGTCPEILEVQDFEMAVLTAAAVASPGDIVILSPAGASFDRFRNFAQRGEFFKKIVSEL